MTIKPVRSFLEDEYGFTTTSERQLRPSWEFFTRMEIRVVLDAQGYCGLQYSEERYEYYRNVFMNDHPLDCVCLWLEGFYFTDRNIMMLFKLSA